MKNNGPIEANKQETLETQEEYNRRVSLSESQYIRDEWFCRISHENRVLHDKGMYVGVGF